MFKRFLIIAVAIALPIMASAQDSPLGVVAHVLSLSEQQVQQLAAFLQARGETIRPLAEQMQAQQQALEQQLQSKDPDAAAIGKAIIAIRQLQAQVQATLAESNKALDTILDADQRARLEQIRNVEPACGVLPAFKAVGLL